MRIENVGSCGMKITTPEYTDFVVFVNDEIVRETARGRAVQRPRGLDPQGR